MPEDPAARDLARQDLAPRDPARQDLAPRAPAPQDPAPQDPAPQDSAPQDPAPAIAIVGVACRFPDADDALTLLDMALAGRRAFRRLPPARLGPAGRHDTDTAEPGLAAPPRAALIEDWQFDRSAFGISESAYRAADPAHWLALETAGRALADAGFPGGQGVPRDRTGVIVGNTLTGAIASRICGHFGFRGGGHTVDGAHSSALLAVVAACSSLSAGDLDFALAGGVDTSLGPFEPGGLGRAGVVAAGDMRVYDASPTGFLPGEGCGIVALMRAEDARAAGMPVYAEIAGWGVSSAGRPGAAGPDPGSQLLALRRAYQRAAVDPAEIQLIEGDGSGIAAADLAELTALVTVREGAQSAAALGSVKANIGHTKAAAGAAGLIKAALAVNAGVIPPVTGCPCPHPLLGGEDATLRVLRTAEPWPDGPRLAAVSAMDCAGSNVHVVLRRDPGPSTGRPELLPVRGELRVGSWTVTARPRADTYVFGGSNREAVSVTLARVAALAPWMSDGEFADLACQLGRAAQGDAPVRVAVVAGRQQELARLANEAAALLPSLTGGQLTVGPGIFASDGARGRVVLLFPGQDAPATGCEGSASPGRGGMAGKASGPADPGASAAASQPAIVHASLSALHWLDRLGVRAAASVGHGLGEITGLVWAGTLSEPDAARLVAQRDAVLSTTDPQRGGMVAVVADAAAAQAFCTGRDLVIAAYNGPRCHVLAGSAAAVREVTRRAARDGIAAYVLGAPHALHSPAMADRVAPLRSVLADFEFGPPSRRLISTVTGRALTALDDIAALLATQLTSPVRFAEALGAAAGDADLLVETGPGQALAALAAGCCEVPAVSLAAGRGDGAASARAAAALFAAGAITSLEPLLAGRPARPVDIWRERIFITNRSAPVPGAEIPEPSGAEPDESPADESQADNAGTATAPATTATPAAGTATPTAGTATPAAGTGLASFPGVGPWARCFAESLRAPRRPVSPVDEEPWRLRATSRQPFGRMAAEVFEDDPDAHGVLAVIGDPADPDACATLVEAARDAITAGQLVVITPRFGLAGFCASLHAEHPSLGITLLRTAESAKGLLAARRFAATEPGQFRELVLDEAGAPLEPAITVAEPRSGDQFPLGPSDVLLVSGAAGADSLAAAEMLADRRARLAVLSPADPGEDAATAARLERLRSGGARVSYEKADITDPDQAEAVIASIEQRLGPVTAVIHAASVSAARMCADTSGEDLRALVSSQADGLTNVLGAISAAKLRLVVTCGSVTARYGAAGTCAGSLASTALAEQARRLALGLAGCRVLHVDWAGEAAAAPAWPGAGPRDPADAASELLVRLLATADPPARVAIHGRVGVPAPPAPMESAPQRVIRGRFLETVQVHYPAIELVADTRLSLPTDPYLADHRVDGLPVLPGVVGLEAMAQVASALAGQHLRHVTDFCMDAPVVIPPGATDGQTVIRVCALRRAESVEVVLRCGSDGFQVDHFRAQFALPGAARSSAARSSAARAGASGPADEASTEIGGAAGGLPAPRSGIARDHVAPAGIVDGTDLYGPICFQSGRFRRVAFLPEVTSRSCRALVRGGDDQPWFGAVAGSVDAPLILGSPGLNDATLHVLQACIPHRRMLPAGCDSVVFSGQEVRGAVQVLAARQPGTGGWNVTAVDATGQSIVTWTGLRMQAVGPLAHAPAWHPALLATSLEGRAAELGLDPDLQVTIRCAQRRPASRAAHTQPAETSGAHIQPAETGPAPVLLPSGESQPVESQPGEGARLLPPHSPWLDAAVGTGPLDGFELVVRAPRPVACHWTTTRPPREGASPRVPWPGHPGTPGHPGAPGHPGDQAEPHLARLGGHLHGQSREPRAAVTARLAVVTACLLAAGWRPGTPLLLDDACEGTWIHLRAGQITVACTIADISGVPGPVAIALATWPVSDQAALKVPRGVAACYTPVAANGSGHSQEADQSAPRSAEP
jgi:enediyne polyketide synthase